MADNIAPVLLGVVLGAFLAAVILFAHHKELSYCVRLLAN